METNFSQNLKNLTHFPYDSNLTGVPWTFVAGLRVLSTTVTLLMNLSGLILLISSRKMVGPLRIYFSNLLIANIAFVSVYAHLDIISYMKSNYWPGWALCDFYLYAGCPMDCMAWAQIIITYDLIWAVTFPLHFHKYHSNKLAVTMCIVMWIFIHFFELALQIRDSLWFRRPGEIHGCKINYDAQPVLSWTVEIIADLPCFLILLAYAYLMWKMRKMIRNRKKLRNSVAETKITTSAPKDELADALRKQAKESWKVFIVLTLLTIIAVFSWIPLAFIYMAQIDGRYEFPKEFDAFARWMSQTSALMDPIVILATSKGLRHELRSIIICGMRKNLWRNSRRRDIVLRALAHARPSNSNSAYNASTSSPTLRAISQNNNCQPLTEEARSTKVLGQCSTE